MIIIFVCFLIAWLVFAVFMVLEGAERVKDFNQRLEIQKKLIESLETRLDLHKL